MNINLKVCNRCFESKSFDLFRFYRGKYYNQCFDCMHKSQKRCYLNKKSEYLARIKKYSQEHPEVNNRATKKYYRLHKEETKARKKIYRTKNPEKFKAYRVKNRIKILARHKLQYAVESGKIIRSPCRCGAVKVQAHHHDYSKPLDVVWLCVTCHSKEHFGELTNA